VETLRYTTELLTSRLERIQQRSRYKVSWCDNSASHNRTLFDLDDVTREPKKLGEGRATDRGRVVAVRSKA